MFTLMCFFFQIFLFQHVFSQAVTTSTGINSVPNSYGNGQNVALPNQYPAQIMPSQQYGGVGNQYGQTVGNQYGQSIGMGVPAGFNSGFSSVYGGNGNGDVTVVGELPVLGNTAVTGNVPLTGKVQFTGNIPAGGIVTISGQCGCGCNSQNNAFGAKTSFNNKPFY